MAYTGRFLPKNPQKYRGNPSNIIYRSTWECRVMNWLDTTESIIEWGSEEIVIPYRSPVDNRVHRYFPDFYVKVKQKDDTIKVMILEIKPEKQTKPPEKKKRVTKQYINEVYMFYLYLILHLQKSTPFVHLHKKSSIFVKCIKKKVCTLFIMGMRIPM